MTKKNTFSRTKILAEKLEATRKELRTTVAGLGEIRQAAEKILEISTAILEKKNSHGSQQGIQPTYAISRREEQIMQGMADAHAAGIPKMTAAWSAIFSGNPRSGAFNSATASLRRKGLLKPPYKWEMMIEMSEKGIELYPPPKKAITQEELLSRLKQSLGNDAWLIVEFCAKHNGSWKLRDLILEQTELGSTRRTQGIVKNLTEIGVIEADKEGKIRAGERIMMKG